MISESPALEKCIGERINLFMITKHTSSFCGTYHNFSSKFCNLLIYPHFKLLVQSFFQQRHLFSENKTLQCSFL